MTREQNPHLRIDKNKSESHSELSRKSALQELLTAKDLEALLQIDAKTIYRYVQSGLIPYVKIQRNVRFAKDEIIAWIEMQSFRPRSMTVKNRRCHIQNLMGHSDIETTRQYLNPDETLKR